MKKLVVLVGLLVIFFSNVASVDAACIPATGFPLSCNGLGNPARCPVGRPGGGGPGVLLCCVDQSECDTYKQQQYYNQIQLPKIEDLCKSDTTGQCVTCFKAGNSWTAIGCIPTDPAGFIGKFLSLGIGIAGGIAFLLILFGGLQILTSAGNPEKLNAGKELITSAISGLILIIFSLFLLRLIGFNILGIPGFGGAENFTPRGPH